jgi:hypothetical protein
MHMQRLEIKRLTRYGILFISLLLTGYGSPGQEARDIEKALKKAVKSAIKEPIRVPGLDIEMAGARGLDLAQAVNRAVDNALKETLNQDHWVTDGMETTDLLQIANSTTPAATFLDYREEGSVNTVRKILEESMQKEGISTLLGSMGTDPGFYISKNDPEAYMDDVYDNMLAFLDNTSRELLEK